MIAENHGTQPDPSELIRQIGLTTPVIGFYDSPTTSGFEPLVKPGPSGHVCIFTFYRQWIKGKTLHLTKENFGCGGAGHWICGVEGRSRKSYLELLVDHEGLRASYELTNQWLDHIKPYKQEYPNILIGPLKKDQYQFLKTITFFAEPDLMSALMIGAEYNRSPHQPPAVKAPFGSGCMQLITVFDDLLAPGAVIGSTDIAARKYIPRELLAFTVTKPMFEQLCNLDEQSFLYKSFWKDLKKAR